MLSSADLQNQETHSRTWLVDKETAILSIWTAIPRHEPASTKSSVYILHGIDLANMEV